MKQPRLASGSASKKATRQSSARGPGQLASIAYFTLGEPTEGNWKITSAYNGATYRFASEEHKAAFEADPEAYLPQYGGFCAFGAAMGFKFDGDPEHWKVVDGELFLNISKDVQERWVTDIPGYVQKADVNWETIEDKAPEELQ